jgi:2,3-bisphosphoglycerate-dependent phosphoglycerate mutase
MTDHGDVAPTRLVMIRHGESRVTVDRIIGGPRTCKGLSDLGRLQAEALRDRLAETGELQATVLYASAYPRAIETAEIIAPALGVPVVEDAGFGEHDPGPDCDGLTFNAFVERYGMPDWESDPHIVTFPGGETVAEFHHRVGATLSRVVHQNPGGAIVVACHGGVIDAAFRALLRLPSHGAFELQTTNTSLTEFVTTRRDRWRLVRYNDAAHLTGLPVETPRSL